jgi:hypothetical protein
MPVHQTPKLPKKRSGHPRMTPAGQENTLCCHLTAHPIRTEKALKNMMAGWLHVSIWTIQDIRLGISSCCTTKKTLLTEKMVRERMSFCKKHWARSEKDLKDVMFSDESIFSPVSYSSQKIRPPSAATSKKNVVTITKHSPVLWCGSAKEGQGLPFFCPQR